MSHSKRLSIEPNVDSLTARFRHSADVTNKPHFRELDPPSRGSISAVNATFSSSSSGSSGSKNSGSSTRTNIKPGHRRSASAGTPLIYSSSSTASSLTSQNGNGTASSSATSSPNHNFLPSGNICPSGKIIKTGMASRVGTRPETLCTGTGKYGHGSIVRKNGKDCDPEEVKRAGNEMYRKGNFEEALVLYEKAIRLLPENAAYRSNRAAALAALGRVGEAVRECQEAVRLDPSYGRAHQRLASLYLRWVLGY